MIESLSRETGEVRDKELNESEPTDEASFFGRAKRPKVERAKISHIRTEGQSGSWDNGRGNLFTDCWVCGVKAASARPLVALLAFLRLFGEREKQAWDAKGKYQARRAEVGSTDVCVCGGLPRSSVETAVMAVERRGQRTAGSLRNVQKISWLNVGGHVSSRDTSAGYDVRTRRLLLSQEQNVPTNFFTITKLEMLYGTYEAGTED